MRIVTTTFWLPKKGNTIDEYEDAAAPIEPFDSVVDTFRCAVADGATETSFSGLWAKLLVNGYVDNEDRNKLKRIWADSVETKELAWYAEQKAQSGAYAALVGLTLKSGKPGKGGTWEAEALGDSCLMLVRGDEFIESFPLSESEQFNSSPFLLSSNLDDPIDPDMLVTKSGAWQDGDIFYLLTDAIARWTCKRQEEHGDAANWLAGMKDPDHMNEFVEIQRELLDSESRPWMRNDDVTMVRVKVTVK